MAASRARWAALAAVLILCGVNVRASEPVRVVCLGPSVTEIVYSLGQGSRVVAVSDYASWPAPVASLPRVGGLMDPNLERIVGLEPDLVLTAAGIPSLERLGGKAGFRVEVVAIDDLEGIHAGILRTSELLGCPREGRRLAAQVRAELEAVKRPEGSGSRVLIQVGRPPGPGLKGLVVAGGRTFIGQLVELVGGRNVFEDAKEHYFSPSLEEVLARAPDVVLVLDAAPLGAESEPRRLIGAWRQLFRKGAPRVKVLADQVFVVPGPRVGLAARRLATVLSGGGGR